MSPRTLAGAALAGLAVVALAPAAHAVPDRAATPKITADGVGKVKLGKRHSVLRAQGLVGKIGPGCELAENTRSASLKPPLKGTANLIRPPPSGGILTSVMPKTDSVEWSTFAFGNFALICGMVAPMPTPRAFAPPLIVMSVTLRGEDCV